jgi:hypothetical protein
MNTAYHLPFKSHRLFEIGFGIQHQFLNSEIGLKLFNIKKS